MSIDSHHFRVQGFYGNRPLVIYERADGGRVPIETRAVNNDNHKFIDTPTGIHIIQMF